MCGCGDLLTEAGGDGVTVTATNHDSRWLFPSRRAGQPTHPDALVALVNDLGIPTSADRASGVREPPWGRPVVADALGYRQVTTVRLAAQAGGTRSRYAPPETTTVTIGLGPAGNWRQLDTRARAP